LTEAECYARCYGAQQSVEFGQVRLIPKPVPRTTIRGEDLRLLFEERLDERGMEAA
jgi:hypothetical protein